MCETFCRPASKATFYGYEIGLADLPIERIEAAVVEAIRTKKFMPTAAELRELCGEAPADSSAAKFIEDCRKAEIECARRRQENPAIPQVSNVQWKPKQITHEAPKSPEQLLRELEACTEFKKP